MKVVCINNKYDNKLYDSYPIDELIIGKVYDVSGTLKIPTHRYDIKEFDVYLITCSLLKLKYWIDKKRFVTIQEYRIRKLKKCYT